MSSIEIEFMSNVCKLLIVSVFPSVWSKWFDYIEKSLIASYELDIRQNIGRKHKLIGGGEKLDTWCEAISVCACAAGSTHMFNHRVNLALEFRALREWELSRQSATVAVKVFGGMSLCARWNASAERQQWQKWMAAQIKWSTHFRDEINNTRNKTKNLTIEMVSHWWIMLTLPVEEKNYSSTTTKNELGEIGT